MSIYLEETACYIPFLGLIIDDDSLILRRVETGESGESGCNFVAWASPDPRCRECTVIHFRQRLNAHLKGNDPIYGRLLYRVHLLFLIPGTPIFLTSGIASGDESES